MVTSIQIRSNVPCLMTLITTGDVKRICETEIGVLSQCCRAKQVYKERNVQYCANVAIKINAKVNLITSQNLCFAKLIEPQDSRCNIYSPCLQAGGRNSVFLNVEASLPVVSKSPTIIFGADVTHPGSFDESTPSIASVRYIYFFLSENIIASITVTAFI